jgi:hypothetical protein
MGDWLEPLRDALDRARNPVTFFFRDDDGGWRDARLLELLDRFGELGLPLDLALIPRDIRPEIANELADRIDASAGQLGVHQHGLAHRNHEREGRRHEFGPSRPRADQLRDIAEGRDLLRARLGARPQPIFTPPWNRCTRVTGKCLADLGFRVLSRESRAEPLGVPGLVELPVDLDWFARRKRIRLTREERMQMLASRIRRGGGPLGVMFHHAVMDRAELEDATLMLELVAAHPCARALPIIELTGAAGSPALGAGTPLAVSQ